MLHVVLITASSLPPWGHGLGFQDCDVIPRGLLIGALGAERPVNVDKPLPAIAGGNANLVVYDLVLHVILHPMTYYTTLASRTFITETHINDLAAISLRNHWRK
jgi:hypothetical protein